MIISKRASLLASSILLGAMFAPAAFAQTRAQAAGAQGAEVGELVVTAQKRDERLLDVPVQVTSVSAETLTKQNLVQLADIYTRVPGLQYSGGRVTGLSIRGINSGGVANPTVAILVDDVPFGGTTGAGQPPIPDFDPATLDHIEVLRGPQGTLYGASSLGGLIKYVTKQPSTTDFSGRVEATGSTVKGGDPGYALRGSVNVPIIQDKVGLLLSGFRRDDPRWLDNISTAPGALGNDVNKKQTYGGRAALLIKPTDDLAVTLTAMRQKFKQAYSDLADSNSTQVCAVCRVPTTGNTAVTAFDPIFNGDIHTLNVAFSDANSDFQLYTGRIAYNLHWADFTSITAYGKANNVVNNDVTAVFGGLLLPPRTGAPADGASVGIANANQTKKYSQEFRLSSQGSTKLEWLGGFFFTGEESKVPQTLTVYNASGAAVATPYVGAGPQKYREMAGFGDVTYHFTDKFDLQVGGRYAQNKQSSVMTLNTTPLGAVAFGASSTTIARSDEKAFTWLVTPSYHISPDMMVYARIASGYRPGGPNTGVVGAASFDSDTVINYEAGFKGYLIPGKLSVDLAAFQIDWKDIQLSNTDAVSQLTFLSNGGKARSRGLEAASTWRPMSGLTIDANAAYTQAELTQNLPVGTNTLRGRDGDRLPFTPKWTASVSAQKDFVIDADITGFVGASYAYTGERMSIFQTNAAAASRPRYSIPSYTSVDLRAGVDVRDAFEVTLFVRNLFDKDGIITSGNRNGTGAPTARFVQPRTAGVTIAKSF
jgi:iron complex outermembrane receptor protein